MVPDPKTTAPLYRVDGGPVLPDGAAVWLLARSGRRVRAALFRPPGVPRGSVVLSPGRTEPIEKYGEVLGELVGRGFVVLTHDWAGQGLSTRFVADALRGDVVGGFRAFLEDYADVVAEHARQLPRPWLALGHSMGGALTALALAERTAPFDGAVLCAPMLEFSSGRLPMRLVELLVAGALAAGREAELVRKQCDPGSLPFETNLLTHDRARYERTQKLYRAYPDLCIGEPTFRWLGFALELRARLARPGAAESIACLLTIVAAGADRIVRTEPMRRFAERVQRGTYVELPSAFHEILMETDDIRARFWDAFDAQANQVAPRPADERVRLA